MKHCLSEEQIAEYKESFSAFGNQLLSLSHFYFNLTSARAQFKILMEMEQ